MEKCNLSLTVTGTLTDAAKPDEPVPFDANMSFNYRGVPYGAAVRIQESFTRAMADHNERLIAMGLAEAEKKATGTGSK